MRSVILEHLPDGFEEGMQYGMIGYYVPLERFPDTYNGEPLSVAALASQKRHMALYMMGVYGATTRGSGSAGRPPAASSTWVRAACASAGWTTYPSTSSERRSRAPRSTT